MPFCAVSQHDNVAGLQTVYPQPFGTPPRYAEVRYAANGSVDRHGDVSFSWRYGYMTPAWFATMRTLLGLSATVKSNDATVQTMQDDRTTFANYNVVAIDPEPEENYQWDGEFYLDVEWRFMKATVIT